MQALSPLNFSYLLGFYSILSNNSSSKSSDMSWDYTFQEFVAILKNKEFDHPLQKELTLKLLKNRKKTQYGFSIYFFIAANFPEFESELSDKYFAEMLFEEYQKMNEEKIEKERNIDGVYLIDFETKIKLFGTIFNQGTFRVERKEEEFEESDEENGEKKQKNQLKKTKQKNDKQRFEEFKSFPHHPLGEDGQYFYLYTKLIPQYVIRFKSFGLIERLSRQKTFKIIEKLSEEPQTSSLALLLQNLLYVYENFQTQEFTKTKVKKTKQKVVIIRDEEKIANIKQLLLAVEQKMSKFLQRHWKKKPHFYAPKVYREQLKESIRKAETEQQLCQLFTSSFFSKMKKKLYSCKNKNENQSSDENSYEKVRGMNFTGEVFFLFPEKQSKIDLQKVCQMIGYERKFKLKKYKLPILEIVLIFLTSRIEEWMQNNSKKIKLEREKLESISANEDSSVNVKTSNLGVKRRKGFANLESDSSEGEQ